MTNSTIDCATIAINLGKSTGTVSPANIGSSGGKRPFDSSLREAVELASSHDGVAEPDSGQLLPPARQEFPLESSLSEGLEGVTEVRALADAMMSISGVTDDASDPINNGLDGSAMSVAFADSMRFTEDFPEVGASRSQIDAGLAAPKPLPVGAATLKSTPGSNSEEISLSLLQGHGKRSGNFDDKNNYDIRPFSNTLPPDSHEARTKISGAGLSLEALSSKENISRPLSLEPSLGLSSTTQSESKFTNSPNVIPTSQLLSMTKQSEPVSSTELATHLRVLKSSGGGEARLQLHPAELGRMTVSLITEGDEARVSFVVDNSSARHAVEMSLPRLRDLMDGAGLSLTDADVSERHSKEDEEKPSGRLTEEAGSSSGSDAEGFEQATPPDTSQLIDAFA